MGVLVFGVCAGLECLLWDLWDKLDGNGSVEEGFIVKWKVVRMHSIA